MLNQVHTQNERQKKPSLYPPNKLFINLAIYIFLKLPWSLPELLPEGSSEVRTAFSSLAEVRNVFSALSTFSRSASTDEESAPTVEDVASMFSQAILILHKKETCWTILLYTDIDMSTCLYNYRRSISFCIKYSPQNQLQLRYSVKWTTDP